MCTATVTRHTQNTHDVNQDVHGNESIMSSTVLLSRERGHDRYGVVPRLGLGETIKTGRGRRECNKVKYAAQRCID